MAKMVSTKISKAAKEANTAPVAMDEPDYPWGMRLRFERELCAALGIKDLPPAGTKLDFCITLEVEENWSRESSNGDDRGFAGVVTNIGKDEPDAKPDGARIMYGGGE